MNREYSVLFEKSAQKSLKKLDKQTSNMIMAWIKKNLVNTKNPRINGKALVAKYSGAWRYRIGNYRIIANIQDEEIIILILEVGHRKDIYK